MQNQRFVMARLVAAFAVIVVAASPARAQTPASHPYGLDPYHPSDAQLLRMYGPALVAQTPPDALATLDPYKPSDAELLREAGGAQPICCLYWSWPGPLPIVAPPVPPMVATQTIRSTRSAPRYSTSEGTVAPTRTAALPRSNDGIWIRFNGQSWVSSGGATRLEAGDFTQVGDYAGQPVYTRTTPGDARIYLRVRDRVLVPFSLKP